MENGYPKYKELITNNPDGLSMMHSMSRYMASTYGGPFIQDKRYFEQYMPYEEQKEAVERWMQHDDGQRMPLVASNEEEREALRGKWATISSLLKENVTKFITGQKSMDEWDGFAEQLRTAGINQYLEVRQQQYERYINR